MHHHILYISSSCIIIKSCSMVRYEPISSCKEFSWVGWYQHLCGRGLIWGVFLKARSLIISLSTPAAAAVDQQRLCGLRTGLPTTLSLSPALPTLSSPNGDKADDHHDAGNKNDEKLDHLKALQMLIRRYMILARNVDVQHHKAILKIPSVHNYTCTRSAGLFFAMLGAIH